MRQESHVRCGKVTRELFDRLDARADGALKVPDVAGSVEGCVLDHPVEVSLVVQLVGRHPDGLRALLPRQVVLAGDVRQTLGLNGVEHAVHDGQEDIGRRQRNRTPGIAIAVDDTDSWHVQLGHLGDEPGDRVGLIRSVGLRVGDGAKRVHEGDDRGQLQRELAHDLDGAEMLLRPPRPVASAAVLGEDPDLAVLTRNLEDNLGGVQRSTTKLAQDAPAQLTDCPRDPGSRRVLGRSDGLLHILVDA